MKFNKIYAFIFALTLFFIGNYSVKAENIFPSGVPKFTFAGTSMCFTNRDNNGEQVTACLNSTIAEELGFNYVILETNNVEYPYIALVLSHYSYYKPYASATTYYYGGKYFINENATDHIGYYVNKYGTKVFNFGNHDTNITTTSYYQFLGYYGGTSYNELINSTTLQTSYNYNTRYHQNYYFGLFLGFKYSTINSAWEHFGVSKEFTLSTNYFTLDENNHVNILYSSFDIYDYDNETIVHTADSKPPAIEEEHEAIDITYKHSIIIKKNNKNSTNSINDIVLFSNTTDENFRFHYKKYNENHLRDETYLSDNQEIQLNNFYYKIPNLNMEDEQIIEISKGIDSDNIVSSSGSSGGGHSSGGGRHDFIQPYKKIVYLDTTEYDYCVLEDVNSECEINGITYNQIYSEFSSSDNIIEDLNQYLNSKTKGIQASNYILTSLWNELEKKYKYTILTMLITSLITIIYLRIVK